MNELPFRRLDAPQAAALLGTSALSVLDVRDPAAYGREHLEGAVHLSGANLNPVLLGGNKKAPVLIYCYHGNASQTYAKMFADFGFTEVYDLIGGFEAWRAWRNAATARSQLPDELRAWLQQHGFPADDLEATIANRSTPLMQACRLGDQPIAAALIAAGAALDPRNADGNNALWLACFSGNLALIALLIDKGIALDNRNDNGATCLMYAASAGKTEVVAALLAAGANPRLTSLDDFTALDMAANVECLQLLRDACRGAPSHAA